MGLRADQGLRQESLLKIEIILSPIDGMFIMEWFCIFSFSVGFAGFFCGQMITATTLMGGEDQMGSISLPSA